ncbi:hypothetical protein JCM11641_003946 [Rhodosporidiobolus odoratus]
MLPNQKKVDISSFSEQEKELFQKYGKVPTHKNLLGNKLKERKYFDSGDYAMSKAGVSPQQSVGTAIPSPADIPHASPNSSSAGGAGTSSGSQATAVPGASTSPGSSGGQGGFGGGGSPTSPSSEGVGVGHGQGIYGSPTKEPITQMSPH